MKKLILSLLILFSAMAYSQGTIPIPSIIGLPAAMAGKVDKVTGKSLVADTLSAKIQPHVTNTANPHSTTKAQVGLGNVDNTSDVNKPISSATQTALNGKQPTGTYSTDIHANITALNAVQGVNHGDQTDITGNAGTATKMQTARTINGVAFDGTQNITVNAVDATSRVASSLLGAANGVATLDANGIILTTQLPSYIDDVLEYTNLAAFPGVGETGKIYVAKDNNKTYRWSGSVYVYITSGAVDSVNGLTGVVSLSKSDIGLSNVDNTSDANKPVSSATQAALNGKQASGTYSTDIHSNITALNAVNGINGGDETLTSIKTKLGAASSSNAGYLTSIDWSTFNSKQPAGAYLTGITSGHVTTALGYTPWWSSNHPTTVSDYGITDIPIYSAYNVAGFHDIPITNANTFFSSDVSGVMTNSGTTGSYGEGIRWCLAGLTNYQRILASNYNGELFFKYQNSGVWSGFAKLYTSANLTNSLSTTYIPKWNGTSFINSLLSEESSRIVIDANITNAYHKLNRNSLTTEHGFMWNTNNNPRWFFGQRSKNSEEGLSLFCAATGLDAIYFRPNGEIALGSSTASTSPTTGALVVTGGVGVGGMINSNGLRIGNSSILDNGTVFLYDNKFHISMTSGGFSLNNSANSANHFWCSNTNGNSNFGYGETDQGYKLAVNGTGLFSGKLRVTDSSQSDMDGTVLNDGAIQTNGGISAVKDINSGANINAYGNLNAYGTVRVAGGTPTQLMTRDGGYVEVGSVGGTSGNGSFTIIGSSNFSSATVQYHNYTLVGNIVTESIRISGNVTSSGYFHVEVTPAFTPKILTVPYAGTGVVDNGSLVPATAWTGTGFPSMIRCVCYNGAASTSHSVSIVIQYEKQ